MITDPRTAVIDLCYLLSAIIFYFGLKRLSHPATARLGNGLTALAMLIAFVVTLLDPSFHWKLINILILVVGSVLGIAVGVYLARSVKMTAMPQMVALFNGMGGGTAALVELSEFTHRTANGINISSGEALAIGLGCAIGSISFAGSMIALLKLQELMTGRPIRFPGQSLGNGALFAVIIAMIVILVGFQGADLFLWILFVVALVLGVAAVIPIGGADMPVVIALLNACTGIAAALTGFVLHNEILVVAGALVGASGGLLTVLMGRAMNRPLSNVLFSGFGAIKTGGGGGTAIGEARPIRETTAEDMGVALAYSNEVIVVPGYGLAVAQAQHQIRELATELEKHGVTVKYAIHPVAGRMPGHMNVLLAEANVPYDQLYEMDQINGEFRQADVALVVGANDVVNPAARNDTSSPIYGMPILNVDQAQTVVVLKRSMRPGFAGIENELFYNPNTVMLFGDAKDSITKLTSA